MIAVRKATPAFADFNNRELIETGEPHLFAFLRTHPLEPNDQVLVVANFDREPHEFDLQVLAKRSLYEFASLRDLCSGKSVDVQDGRFTVPPCRGFWLSDRAF